MEFEPPRSDPQFTAVLWSVLPASRYWLSRFECEPEACGRGLDFIFEYFCGAIVLAILLGIFAGRYVFAGIISILYVFDLVQFHQFLAAVTGDSSKDSGIGYGYLFTLFINLAGFAAAVFIDHIVQLVQRRTKA